MTTNPREEQVKAQRPTRTPLGARNLLTVDGLKDRDRFVYRWMSAANGKCEAAVAAGWVFVGKNGLVVGDVDVESGKGVGSVTTKKDRAGYQLYLMKQDRETWLLDRKNRVDDPTDATEQAQMAGSTHREKGLDRGSVQIQQRRATRAEIAGEE